MHYLIGLLTGAGLVFGALLLTAPNCPTEDSCEPNYVKVLDFGFWTAKEVTP